MISYDFNYDRMKSFHTFSSLEKEWKTEQNRTEQNKTIEKLLRRKLEGK